MDKDNTSRLGIAKCEFIINKMGLIFREQPISDYGIDAIIETKDPEYPTGKMIAVQIKSGESYFDEKKNDSVIFRGDIKHYNYWANHSLPVIIVLYSPITDKCIWVQFDKDKVQKTDVDWKIQVPENQILENAYVRLAQIAENQSDFDRRWTSLAFAREWMLEAKRKKNIILEVQEWVNKTSGKGDFTLKSIDDAGNEIILYSKTWFGFGLRNYEWVIQELFPWANCVIDELFYEMNMDEECLLRKSLTDRDIAKSCGISGSRLLEYSDAPPLIYPYKNVIGEVDKYRLKLSLNSIGESFLIIDDFLANGKCYYIGTQKCVTY